jgi:RimJ/RimL family protein N-acetyltransferase
MPSFPDLDQPLTGDGLAVRAAAERDIPEVLIAYQDDPELHLRMGEERAPSGAELGRLAERAAADRAAGRGATLTIVRPGSDVCVGQLNVHHADWDNARVELGMWLAPQARGRGLAPAALRLVARWLLLEVGFERVQLLTETGNERLLRAAAAAGFQPEGVLHGFLREQGARVDAVVLSLVHRDLAG